MSRLTKYLESLMSKKDSLKQAETTSSIYYFIDGIKIRVSDHFPSDRKSDISIINPLNQKTSYLVQIKEGPQVLQFTFKDLKVFISNYCYVKKIATLNKEVQNSRQNKTLEVISKKTVENTPSEGTFAEALLAAQRNAKTKKEKNLTRLIGKLPYTKEGLTWLEITTLLSQEEPKYSSITPAKKKVLRNHLYHKSIKEIQDIVKYILDEGLDAEQIKTYFNTK